MERHSVVGRFFAAGQHLNGSFMDPVERASRCRCGHQYVREVAV